MTYVMSDLHGCYAEYLRALETIDLQEDDTLYILGDILDRGPEPVRLLQDIMARSNVILLVGNHEYMAMRVLSRLCVEITEANAGQGLSAEDITAIANWSMNGGDITLRQFREADRSDLWDMLDYLNDCPIAEEVKVRGRRYVLVHAGLDNFSARRPLEDYDLFEVAFHSPDFSRTYYRTKYLVTGHTPTAAVDPAMSGQIIEKRRHIALDCGCVFGLGLGVYCLDTREKWVIPSENYMK